MSAMAISKTLYDLTRHYFLLNNRTFVLLSLVASECIYPFYERGLYAIARSRIPAPTAGFGLLSLRGGLL